MKTKIKIALAALFCAIFNGEAQIIADFETFTLSPNSAYSPSTTTSWQTSNASFNYTYDFNFWLGGFAYTNHYDSITGDFTNLYGVRAYKGYNNSAIYVVGQDGGVITTTAIPQTTVSGFYITNTTYAYKTMAKGDMFSRKFGDTTGTGSGTTIAQGAYPDYFKVIVKGYKNGALKNDSVTAMLADYTFSNNAQDYILNTWQWVNTGILGEVDSIKFTMRSTDTSFGFINTPAFFAIDNFTTIKREYVGIQPHAKNDLLMAIYPNPCNSSFSVKLFSSPESVCKVALTDVTGKEVFSQTVNRMETVIEMEHLTAGIYFLELRAGEQRTIKKLIKN